MIYPVRVFLGGWHRSPCRRVSVAVSGSASAGPVIDSGVGPAAMTKGGWIRREIARWRGVCGPPSLECSRRGSCRRCRAPRLHRRRWGRPAAARRYALGAKSSRKSASASRTREQARVSSSADCAGAEAVRKVHFARLCIVFGVDRGPQNHPFTARRIPSEGKPTRAGPPHRTGSSALIGGTERKRAKRSEARINPRECRPPSWLRGGYSVFLYGKSARRRDIRVIRSG